MDLVTIKRHLKDLGYINRQYNSKFATDEEIKESLLPAHVWMSYNWKSSTLSLDDHIKEIADEFIEAFI